MVMSTPDLYNATNAILRRITPKGFELGVAEQLDGSMLVQLHRGMGRDMQYAAVRLEVRRMRGAMMEGGGAVVAIVTEAVEYLRTIIEPSRWRFRIHTKQRKLRKLPA